jgi:hypothetical protein
VSGQGHNKIATLLFFIVVNFSLTLIVISCVGSFLEDRDLRSKEEQIGNLQIKNDNLHYQLTMCRMLVGK